MKIVYISFATLFFALFLLGLMFVWTAIVYWMRDNRVGKRLKKLFGMR